MDNGNFFLQDGRMGSGMRGFFLGLLLLGFATGGWAAPQEASYQVLGEEGKVLEEGTFLRAGRFSYPYWIGQSTFVGALVAAGWLYFSSLSENIYPQWSFWGAGAAAALFAAANSWREQVSLPEKGLIQAHHFEPVLKLAEHLRYHQYFGFYAFDSQRKLLPATIEWSRIFFRKHAQGNWEPYLQYQIFGETYLESAEGLWELQEDLKNLGWWIEAGHPLLQAQFQPLAVGELARAALVFPLQLEPELLQALRLQPPGPGEVYVLLLDEIRTPLQFWNPSLYAVSRVALRKPEPQDFQLAGQGRHHLLDFGYRLPVNVHAPLPASQYPKEMLIRRFNFLASLRGNGEALSLTPEVLQKFSCAETLWRARQTGFYKTPGYREG